MMLSIDKNVDAESLDAARSSLVAVSGQDFGSNIDDWMAWYEKSVGPPTPVLQISHNMYKIRLKIQEIERRKRGSQ